MSESELAFVGRPSQDAIEVLKLQDKLKETKERYILFISEVKQAVSDYVYVPDANSLASILKEKLMIDDVTINGLREENSYILQQKQEDNSELLRYMAQCMRQSYNQILSLQHEKMMLKQMNHIQDLQISAFLPQRTKKLPLRRRISIIKCVIIFIVRLKNIEKPKQSPNMLFQMAKTKDVKISTQMETLIGTALLRRPILAKIQEPTNDFFKEGRLQQIQQFNELQQLARDKQVFLEQNKELQTKISQMQQELTAAQLSIASYQTVVPSSKFQSVCFENERIFSQLELKSQELNQTRQQLEESRSLIVKLQIELDNSAGLLTKLAEMRAQKISFMNQEKEKNVTHSKQQDTLQKSSAVCLSKESKSDDISKQIKDLQLFEDENEQQRLVSYTKKYQQLKTRDNGLINYSDTIKQLSTTARSGYDVSVKINDLVDI